MAWVAPAVVVVLEVADLVVLEVADPVVREPVVVLVAGEASVVPAPLPFATTE